MFEIKDCKNMEDIRKSIEVLDDEIVQLLAKRSLYVKESAKFKKSLQEIKNANRVKEVLESKKELAIKYGVSSTLIHDLYKIMLTHFLKEEQEQEEFENQKNNPKTVKIAIIGDYNEKVTAHICISQAFSLSYNKTQIDVDFSWIDTRRVNIKHLKKFDAIWCAPSSPYKSMQGVLNAINFARTNNVPFLGTCAGYQYTAIEFARNELDYINAEHQEVNKDASMPLFTLLPSITEEREVDVFLYKNSLLKKIYNKQHIKEEFEGNYVLNSKYAHIFNNSAMTLVAMNKNKEAKALEIKENRFFIATAFQPERSALIGKSHCLIEHFINCAYEYKLLNKQS
ncbi:MAG: hypothetical protein COA66_06080 [Arcobacter sp.]|nr:MAG: hypothetical protein COA66_06080 [Arcobacter sp.]